MQPLNHDMDELMRRAATDYPVKPQGADWEKVAQQLDATDGKEAVAGRHELLKKLLLLLPFVLASYVCDQFLQKEYGDLKKMEVASVGMGNKIAVNDPVTTPPSTESTNTKAQTSNTPTAIKATRETTKPVLQKNSAGVSAPGMDFLKSAATASPNKSADAEFTAASFYIDAAQLQPKTITQSIQPLTIAPRPAFVSGPENLGKKATPANWQKAYISLLMGPDFSRVKSESKRSAGYSIGVVAGYNVTKHWGIETGVLWDKKNYFSTGEYFKTDKIYLPHNSEVVQVDGYCAMFEIPLTVRYTWLRKSNTVLSAAAGVSSYLMKNENYAYIYKRYGVDYAGNSNYKNASKNWFAVANFSIAYEHNIGVKSKIHIEPYVKVPLRGVGIGSLPLRSTGVLVGITRTIH